MDISDSFDAGNIEVVEATDPQDVRLKIRVDHRSEHFQWFHFRVSGARSTALRLRIENAGAASYVDGWQGYQACFSYDRETWRRVPDTSFTVAESFPVVPNTSTTRSTPEMLTTFRTLSG